MPKVVYSTRAKEDLEFWKQNDPRYLKRIDTLLKAIESNPFVGIGKPEPLKNQLSGFWSRRIDAKHRLVYMVHNDKIYIAQCRHHY